jgi:hypothetical protein
MICSVAVDMLLPARLICCLLLALQLVVVARAPGVGA